MRVLIADDSKTERFILSALLRKWGYDYVVAEDGMEALKIMMSPDHPRIAILDWVMPGLTGPEVVQYIRKKLPDNYVYCILVTSLGSKEDIVKGLEAGADDYITKPVHRGELQVRLRAAGRLIDAWENLAKSEEQTRAIIDSAGDAILLMAEDGTINYTNPTAAGLLAANDADLRGASFYDHLVTPTDQKLIATQIEAFDIAGGSVGSTDRVEVNIKLGTGETGTVSLAVAPLNHAGTRSISIFMTDVSERKRLEVQLQHAQKLEAVGQLAAGIAHEINTPVQFVGDSMSYLQQSFEDIDELLKIYEEISETVPEGVLNDALLDRLDDAADMADLEYQREQIPKAFGRTQEGLDRVTRIVSAMKEFSRRDSTLEMSAADLNRAIQSTLTVAQNEYRYVADIDLQLDELPNVYCNLGDLNQVFLNLIVNASHAIEDVHQKAGKRGTITISTEKEAGDWVVIKIKDTGTGIPEEVRARMFEPFFTTKDVGKGSGQGLAIAHSMVVDKHGGQLSFETEMGVGTTFIIRLPVKGR